MKPKTLPEASREIRSRRETARGFSLLETLIVSILVAVLATAVLQSLAFALQAHARTRESWRSTLDLWNRSALARAAPNPDGTSFRPIPSARPIRLSTIEDPESGRPVKWEVLRAEK